MELQAYLSQVGAHLVSIEWVEWIGFSVWFWSVVCDNWNFSTSSWHKQPTRGSQNIAYHCKLLDKHGQESVQTIGAPPKVKYKYIYIYIYIHSYSMMLVCVCFLFFCWPSMISGNRKKGDKNSMLACLNENNISLFIFILHITMCDD